MKYSQDDQFPQCCQSELEINSVIVSNNTKPSLVYFKCRSCNYVYLKSVYHPVNMTFAEKRTFIQNQITHLKAKLIQSNAI